MPSLRRSLVPAVATLAGSLWGISACFETSAAVPCAETTCLADVSHGEEEGGTSVDPPACASNCVAPVPTRIFPTTSTAAKFAGCIYASPVAIGQGDSRAILVVTGSGEVAALHPRTGAPKWQITLPAPDGEVAMAVATPVLVGDLAVVAYHTRPANGQKPHVALQRLRHRVIVIQTESGAIDPTFPVVDLTASLPGAGGDIVFEPDHGLARSTLVHGVPAGQTLGRIYVTFGNVRDIQPWHGWIFEVDLDDWKAKGKEFAIHSRFVTTPETDCGVRGESGSRDRKCGGGLWSPSGPLLYKDDNGYSLVVAAGNGQLDIPRHDYANTLMRLRPGLAFEAGCNTERCSSFDKNAPQEACVTSCQDLFVPRLKPNQSFVVESGACDGVSLFECWQRLDYVGGSTPARVKIGPSQFGFAYPAKDGALYLVDETHMGKMHDRVQLVSVCGTKSDPCTMDWAGMIVTQPSVVQQAHGDLVIVPTFMPDSTHPAGVVALRVVGGESPHFESLWQFPDFDSNEARTRFRRHPSRLAIDATGTYGWIVEAAAAGGRGKLTKIRLADGVKSAETDLVSAGMRFASPLIDNDVVYINSCDSDEGPGRVEAYSAN